MDASPPGLLLTLQLHRRGSHIDPQLSDLILYHPARVAVRSPPPYAGLMTIH